MLPHSRCNYIESTSKILISAAPLPESIDPILSLGFSLFVDLRDEVDMSYISVISTKARYINFQIPNGGIVSKDKIINLINYLVNEYNLGTKIVIHCSGGHGRAGMIGALMLGRIFNLDGPTAIYYIEQSRETRIDKSRNFIPTPETNKQVNLIIELLGHGNKQIPNRDDKTWIKIVNAERRKAKQKLI